jgi:hypothetical protein
MCSSYDDYIFVYAIWQEACHQNRKKKKSWSSMSHVNCHHKIYSRYEDIFIYISITKNCQCKLIKDMKRHVNHNGDWRRINKDLATMNHTSEKSKQESWHWDTRCDGEWQVDVWVRGINQAVKSHIVLSVDISWIKINWCDVEKKRSLGCIRLRSPLLLAQGKVGQV